MAEQATLERSTNAEVEYFDVLIVGAGISGIGSAYHLQQQCPDKSFVILEALESFGGTWLMHKYPGIRSDSDLYTFGYRFKPWIGPPIATAGEILKYMGEVIDENDLGPHIRYGHKIVSAEWSSADKRWLITAQKADTGETVQIAANFFWMCQGYYQHEKGYTPDWPGMDRFKGPIVHPQTWPENLDFKDKKVVIIGSGATAATLAPAMAGDAEHVTVLQRSPTYFRCGSNANPLADQLRELQVDETWIHEIVRRAILKEHEYFVRVSEAQPELMKEELFNLMREFISDEEIARNFTPSYRPWQQRIAFVPDGDIFQGIRAGKASVVTDTIKAFDETGIQLDSGKHLDADIIVAATGFNMTILNKMKLVVDGKPVNLADTVTYRGMMFTGVPNLLWVMGYFRASWTLRVDMLGDFVCKLLRHMDDKGVRQVNVELRPEDKDMPLLKWIEDENFNPGYLQRSMDQLPKRGDKHEWRHNQDYWLEKEQIPFIDLDDAAFVYS